MVSAGTVTGDSAQLEQAASNYLSQLEGLSSWQGASHDSIVSQGTDFHSEMEQVASGMNSFATAVSLYEKYKDTKDRCNSYKSQISSSNDESTNSHFRSLVSECESKMSEYASQIKAALSQASSYKLSATGLAAALDASASGQTTMTTTTTGDLVAQEVSSEGGQFVADNTKGVYGHITIDGRTFTIFRQSQISGWARDCNRAAASSIASAYAGANQAVDVAKKSKGGLGYKNDVTNAYFNQFGLTANVRPVNGSYDSIKNDLVNAMKNGNYVMFDLSQSNVHGQSGQKWTSERHWVSVLDIKRTGSGENDYAIFISDSGHAGSTKDYGLGTGWYSINEFSGQKIANFTTISPNKPVAV